VTAQLLSEILDIPLWVICDIEVDAYQVMFMDTETGDRELMSLPEAIELCKVWAFKHGFDIMSSHTGRCTAENRTDMVMGMTEYDGVVRYCEVIRLELENKNEEHREPDVH